MATHKVKILDHVIRRGQHTVLIEVPKELSKEVAEGNVDLTVTTVKSKNNE
jgi:hypothetical protein